MEGKRCKKTFTSFDLCSCKDGVVIMVRVIGRAGCGGKNRNFENLRYRQVAEAVGRGTSESEVKRKVWAV